jgi:hypothetical protein
MQPVDSALKGCLIFYFEIMERKTV